MWGSFVQSQRGPGAPVGPLARSATSSVVPSSGVPASAPAPAPAPAPVPVPAATGGVVFFDATTRGPLPNCTAAADTKSSLEMYVTGNNLKLLPARKKRALGSDGPGEGPVAAHQPVASHNMYGNLGGMGSLVVPVTETRTLAGHIVRDFEMGFLHALTENRVGPGLPCRLYFDLDIKFDTKAQVAEAENALPTIVQVIDEQVRKFYPGLVGTATGAGAGAAAAAAAAGAVPLFSEDSVFSFSQMSQLSSGGGGAGGGLATATLRSGTACLYDEDSQSQFGRVAAGPVTGSGGLFTALVLASGVRPAPPPAYGSAGVHIVFPKLYVTVEQALYVCAAIIARLDSLRVPCGAGEGWKDRLDRAVYSERRGLRWAWQVKAAPCPACAGASRDTREPCRMCRRSGQVADRAASWYTPRARVVDGVLTDMATLCAVTRPTVDLLMEASIRGAEAVAVPTLGWELYEGHPPLPLVKISRNEVRVYDDAAAAKVQAPKDAALDLAHGDPRTAVLQAAARRMRAEYKALTVTRVLERKGMGAARCPKYRVYVSGTGATYCQNKRASHRSNSIRFWATKEGLQQECHSPHVYNGVVCTAYKSAPMPFTTEERAVLFPTAATAAMNASASGGSGAGSGAGAGAGVGAGLGAAAGAGPGAGAGPAGGAAGGFGFGSVGASAAAAAAAAGLHMNAPVTGAMWASLDVDTATIANAHTGHTPREQQVSSLKTVHAMAAASRRRAALLRALEVAAARAAADAEAEAEAAAALEEAEW